MVLGETTDIKGELTDHGAIEDDSKGAVAAEDKENVDAQVNQVRLAQVIASCQREQR